MNMTLEQVIRNAITGILHEYVPESEKNDIQDLLDILIDYGSVTDHSLKDLLKK